MSSGGRRWRGSIRHLLHEENNEYKCVPRTGWWPSFVVFFLLSLLTFVCGASRSSQPGCEVEEVLIAARLEA